ncbi:MAG: hypothetical protein JNM94_15460 [Phycisphaerae bacterium]|nr:hypothetical protein [Phycisphaerae bacterium]
MLNSAVVNAWLYAHIGVLLVVVAYATCSYAMFSRAVERGRACVADSPIRTLMIGLLVSVPLVVAALVLSSAANGVIKLVGVSLLLGWLTTALLGLAPLALHVGARGEAGNIRWTTVARGASFVTLTWMLPVAGWFVAMPLSLAFGVGCAVRAAGRRAATPVATLT